jgi:4-hydroxybenzoate polyprenyltransferase
MVFSFTFFTYNGQRLIRLKEKLIHPENLSKGIKWTIKHKIILSVFCIFSGIVGMICSLYIHPTSWLILIPMGILSTTYVIPIIPFYKNCPSLRDLPYLKIFIIGLVWSLIIVGLPMLDTQSILKINTKLILALTQNFLFIIAITLPFDVRDLKFDEIINLKTIPRLIGVKNSILLAEILLLISIIILFFLLPNLAHFYGLLIGHLITMFLILLTTQKRKELFFTGLIEGTVLLLYFSVLITDYLFSL